jgi:hypothetical protein
LDELDSHGFELVRSALPVGLVERRQPFILNINSHNMEIDKELTNFRTVRLEDVNIGNVLFEFGDASHLILPFQAPRSLLAFIRGFTHVIVARPENFTCRSPLEELIPRTGLNYSFVEGKLLSNLDCDESCSCVSDARYRVMSDDLGFIHAQ